MFFIGFPGETFEQMKETFDLIRSCNADLDFATVGTFALERDSPIWHRPSDFGILHILGAEDPYRVVFDYVDISGNLQTRADLRQVLRAYLEHYADLMPKFVGIVERSCGVFYGPPMQCRENVQ